MGGNLVSLKARLARRLTSLKQYTSRQIYHIAPPDNWALYWEAEYASRMLREKYQLATQRAENIWGYHHQIIHFLDRYMYLNGPFEQLHPSNKVFLTWYHGENDSSALDMQRLFQKLLTALPHLEQIVTSCQISRDILEKSGVPSQQISIIPIGVDLTRFHPPSPQERQAIRAKLGIPEDVICIGSFQKDGNGWGEGDTPKLIKGPDVFLECIAQLAKSYPKLMVLLTGPARGYVKNGLEKIGVPYRHQFFQDYYAVAEYYHALDLYLITSRNEGGPKAMMESWASGVPLVSTQMGMPADWMQHAQNGMLASVENVAGLVDGAIALIEDEALRQHCQAQGLQDVQPLGWPAIAELYYALYKPFLR